MKITTKRERDLAQRQIEKLTQQVLATKAGRELMALYVEVDAYHEKYMARRIKRLADFERKRNLNAELLEATRDMAAGRWARKTEFIPRKDGQILRRITLRDGTVEKQHIVSMDGPAAARARTGLSQSRFAAALGVSTRTLQEWEQGRRAPTGAARSLLAIARTRPDVFREVLATTI